MMRGLQINEQRKLPNQYSLHYFEWKHVASSHRVQLYTGESGAGCIFGFTLLFRLGSFQELLINLTTISVCKCVEGGMVLINLQHLR